MGHTGRAIGELDGIHGRSAAATRGVERPHPPVRLIEELAANAWPPLVQQVVDGWRLRHTPGVRARRSSSVLPLADAGPTSTSLDERIELAETFYRSRGEPIRFQLSPAAWPGDLDAILESRGFSVEAPVDVQVARLEDVLEGRGGPGEVVLHERPDDRWMSFWTQLFNRGDANVARERILDRIAPPTVFARLELAGKDVSLGMGVLERGWLGLFSMGTEPSARRRGAATAVLRSLAGWARERGAANAYLQVEAENDAAQSLYARAGFTTLYRYHYRSKET